MHVAFFAERVALSAEEVRSLTAGGAADPCWTEPRDRLLVESVDQLHDMSDIDDELWDRLASAFDAPQLLDLLLLCGWYHAISSVARATRVTLEGFAPRFADVICA